MEQTEIAREQGAPAASILAEQAWEGKVRKVFSWIVSVYLCVVFGAFPLYFHNYYYDILVSKYQFLLAQHGCDAGVMPDRSDSICVHGLKAVWRGACAALFLARFDRLN